jgi:hypothetical protein
MKQPWIQTTCRAVIPALLILSLGAAQAERHENATVLPPQGHPYGKTYPEWSAAWWQWSSAIRIADSPLFDETGANVASGQSGPVWFLAGNSGGTSVRTVTVPRGKALFFPILTQGYLGFPCDDRNLPGCEIDQALEATKDISTLLSFIDPSMDGATLACEIDGVSVQNLSAYRVRSSESYTVNVPEDNIYVPAFGLPGGAYHPCVDVGYYLMLVPLSIGQHSIHFAGASVFGFSSEVTYHLTVSP